MENKQTQKIMAWTQIAVGLLMLLLAAIRWLNPHPGSSHPNTVLTIIFGIVFPIRAVQVLWQLKQEKEHRQIP